MAPRIPDDLGKIVEHLVASGATDDEIHTVMLAHGMQPVATPSPRTGQTPAQIRGFNFTKDNATRDYEGAPVTSGPLDMFTSGATMGAAPKIEGAVHGLANMAGAHPLDALKLLASGGTGMASLSPEASQLMGDTYLKDVTAHQTADKAYAAKHGTLAPFLKLAGGAATGLAGGAPGLGSGFWGGMGTGAGYGAIQGANDAAPGQEGTAAIGGAVGGGLVSGGLGLLGTVANKTGISKWASNKASDAAGWLGNKTGSDALTALSNSLGSKGAAADEIVQRAKLAGITPDDVLATLRQRAGQPQMPADVLGSGVQELQGDVYRAGGPTSIKLGTAVANRAKGAAPLADAELATTAGQPPITNGQQAKATLDALEKERGNLGKQFEDWHNANRGDFNDPAIDRAMEFAPLAKLFSKVEAIRTGNPNAAPLPIRPGTPQLPPNMLPSGGAPDPAFLAKWQAMAGGKGDQTVPDLEAIHLMERALGKATRGVFQNDQSNPINQDEAAAMVPIVKAFREKIAPPGSDADKLFQAYRSNRQQAEALQTGVDLFKKKGATAVTTLESDVAQMTPAELATFRQGATAALRDRIGGKDVPISGFTDAIAAKALPQAPDKMRLARLAFPDDASWQQALQQASGQRAMAQTREATLGGSPTVKFGQGQAKPFAVTQPTIPATAHQGARQALLSLMGALNRSGAQRDVQAAGEWLLPQGGQAAADAVRSMGRASVDRAKRPGANAIQNLLSAITAQR